MKNRTLIVSVVVAGLVLYWLSTLRKQEEKPVKNEALRKSQANDYFVQIEGILDQARRRGRNLSTAELQQIEYLKSKLLELGFEYVIPQQQGMSLASRQWAAQYNPN